MKLVACWFLELVKPVFEDLNDGSWHILFMLLITNLKYLLQAFGPFILFL